MYKMVRLNLIKINLSELHWVHFIKSQICGIKGCGLYQYFIFLVFLIWEETQGKT